MKFINIKFHILSIIEFHCRYTFISTVVWVASIFFSIAFAFLNKWVLFLISINAISFAILGKLRRYEKCLNSRISNKNGIIWDVSVNGIKVGCIPDWVYAHILKRALFDQMTWLFELSNLLSYFKNILLEMFLGIPALAFWVILYILTFFPDNFMNINTLNVNLNSDWVWFFQVKFLISYILFSFMIRIIFVVLSKMKFGMFEYFNLNVSARVKGFVKFAGDGKISVYSHQNGKYILANKYTKI